MNMNYPHILEKNKNNRKYLRFVKAINDETGHISPAECMPENWENVRHITGNIYYAWDDEPLLGQIYLAEYD